MTQNSPERRNRSLNFPGSIAQALLDFCSRLGQKAEHPAIALEKRVVDPELLAEMEQIQAEVDDEMEAHQSEIEAGIERVKEVVEAFLPSCYAFLSSIDTGIDAESSGVSFDILPGMNVVSGDIWIAWKRKKDDHVSQSIHISVGVDLSSTSRILVAVNAQMANVKDQGKLYISCDDVDNAIDLVKRELTTIRREYAYIHPPLVD